MALRTSIFCVFFITFWCLVYSKVLDPDPPVIPSKGAVWPKPQELVNSTNFLIFDISTFEFKVTGEDCNVLQDALARYLRIISMEIGVDALSGSDIVQSSEELKNNDDYKGFLNKLDVRLSGSCKEIQYPDADMNEEYVLTISKENSKNYLTAPSIWGILRGLETFSQLIYKDQELVKINCTYIHDFPRFRYRGLMVDTSRHFIPIGKLLLIIEAMSYNKLNVFHWHMTDDVSFPYVSKVYPELSKKGAYSQKMTYSPSDIQRIVSYASARGIRVIPEFDAPGHTKSWGKGIPGLLTECYQNGNFSGKFGPIDPTKPSTYEFLRNLYEEILSVFPDSFIHLGGDEVSLDCWENNPNVKEFMRQSNLSNFVDLQQYYMEKVFQMIEDFEGVSIVWEDIFNTNMLLEKNTIIDVWRAPWNESVANVTKAGYPVLLSAGFYLDYIEFGGDWLKFYHNEPTNFIGTEEQKNLVIGGEACMWSETVNEYNIESRIWPRASAVAERLWSAKEPDEYSVAAPRLEEHACRMNKRGISAQPPNGAGFCIV